MNRSVLSLTKENQVVKKVKKITKGDLCNEWLHSFPLFNKKVPFRVGIYEELKKEHAKLERDQGKDFGFRWVRMQLKNRVKKNWYQKSLEKRVPRCNLDGTEVDPELDYLTGK